MENYSYWKNKTVKVVVDRPLGSAHPDFSDLRYELNYGYVPGEISEYDGEEVDAYVLGVDKPIKEFFGQVIAIIKRLSGDREIKLIVAKKIFTKPQIKKAIEFQEKYFKYEIYMF